MRALYSVLIFLFSATMFAGEYSEVKKLDASAEGVTHFDIDCGSGFLKVKGVEGLDKIMVEAEIVVKNVRRDDVQEYIERRVRLELETDGNRAYLKSKTENSDWSRGNAYVNLRIEMPKNMDLTIDDGSGSMEIRNITGDLTVDDGSGSLDIEKISGNVRVDDGSGSVEIWDITGDVDVDDGSGSMTIEKIDGSVTVRDGSGSINIDGISKDVDIREAGSGGVNIYDVKGTVSSYK